MEGIWNVYFEEKSVGSCRVCREGLYFHLSCRCSKASEEICRLMAQCGEETVDLGVLVPVDGRFSLERSVPVKKLPKGQPRFFIRTQKQNGDDTFIPVADGNEFAYLSRLGQARFARLNGKVGVFLK